MLPLVDAAVGDDKIPRSFGVSGSTVYRTRRRWEPEPPSRQDDEV
ncbi:hypothetical protein JJC00_07945 [Bradyrhizobium diazoefficiens]|nr:hypothetical protein [Bradyrhizobium diazoefficiens]QQO37567.1 hypothetical protein JJC00_07945 [Bradyrhizobium diazoefficiens]